MKDIEDKKDNKENVKESSKENIKKDVKESSKENSKENNKKDIKESNKEKNEISEEKLDKIRNEIKNNKKANKLSDNEKSARRKSLANIAMGIFLIVYYDLVLMGSYRLPTIEYLIDLKTFVIFQLIISIFLFERAFRTSSRPLKYAGCELLANSGMTLVIYNLFARQSTQISIYVSCFIGVIAVYYIIKSIVIIKLK